MALSRDQGLCGDHLVTILQMRPPVTDRPASVDEEDRGQHNRGRLDHRAVGKLRRRFDTDQICDLERIDRQIAERDVELAEMVDDMPFTCATSTASGRSRPRSSSVRSPTLPGSATGTTSAGDGTPAGGLSN